MMRRWIALIGAALVAAATSVGIALAGGHQTASSTPAKAGAPALASARHHDIAPNHAASQVTARRAETTPDKADREANEDNPADHHTGTATKAETDNVQHGDQNAPDNTAENGGENESGTDTETGQPGEPPAGQGHQDLGSNGQEDPNAQHECTGDCIE